MFYDLSHNLQMRLIASLIVTFALAAGLISVLSQQSPSFNIFTDGSRAIFSFPDSNWDAVFGTISLREMNDKLNAVLGKVEELQQDLNATRVKVNTLEQDLNATRADLNATRAELDAFKAQQVVWLLFALIFLMHFRSRTSCRTTRLQSDWLTTLFVPIVIVQLIL
jgi:hypothetical protein